MNDDDDDDDDDGAFYSSWLRADGWRGYASNVTVI